MDKKYNDEREDNKIKIKRIMSTLSGHPTWWHEVTGSPATNEDVLEKKQSRQKENEKTKESNMNSDENSLRQKMSTDKQFEENCKKAANLKQSQMNDKQM